MNHYNAIRHAIRRPFTLRMRVALWAGGLMAISVVGLLVLINITTTASTSPRQVTMTIPSNLLMPGWEVSSGLILDGSSGESTLAASPTNGATGIESGSQPVSLVIPASKVERIQEDVFHQMRVFSLIALGLMVLVVGAGSYWMAGRALKPLRELAVTAGNVDADKLNTRLKTQAPDDEVRQLSESLDQMLRRLDTAFEQQGRFVADAAHELRTPLATLRTTVDVISAETHFIPEDYRALGLTLEPAIVRLQDLVNNLLLMATGQNAIAKTPIVLEPLLEEAAAELEPLACAKSVSCSLNYAESEEGLIIHGDAVLLTRVFQNLIENAIYYNRPGGQVRISTSQEPGWVVVTVADTGIGIAPEQLSHIFERFYRADSSRSRNGGGAGLGLSIVEHVVKLHRGQIEVKSIPGIGSTFTARLPL